MLLESVKISWIGLIDGDDMADIDNLKTGNWPPRHVICAGMVVVQKGRVLLIRQAPGTSLAGQWSIPWGLVDEGETADKAAVRETLEEGGITANIQGLLGIHYVSWRFATAIIFLGHHISGIPTADHIETDAAVYFSQDDLAALDEPIEPWTEWLVKRVLAGDYSIVKQNRSGPFPEPAFI